jgi:lipopolysaccharide/colanic/teichoic acid biosynthesis glycosyltransferase
VSSLSSTIRIGAVKFADFAGWLNFVDQRLVSEFYRASEHGFSGSLNFVKSGGWHGKFKRVVDVVVSIFAIVALAPVFIVAFVLIKLTSSGPVLYKSERIGYGGRPFTLYGFRTMYSSADVQIHKEFIRQVIKNSVLDRPAFQLTNDPRITTVGRWLRRTAIDVLPQFFNVLTGDMTLVGPRPLTDLELDMIYESNDEKYRARISLKPGITGLYQVHAKRWEPIDFAEYLNTRSAKLDLEIFLNWSYRVISNVESIEVEQ